MAVSIEVRPEGDAFEVTVTEGDGQTRHRVTASPRVAPGLSRTRVVEASFRFLLDREPKEAILSSFDLGLIPRYFPDFERKLADYLR